MSGTRGKVANHPRSMADNTRRQPLPQFLCSCSATHNTRGQPLPQFSCSHSGADDTRRQPLPQFSGGRSGTYYSGGRVLIRGGLTTRTKDRGADSHATRQIFSYGHADTDEDDEFHEDFDEDNDGVDANGSTHDSPRNSPHNSPRGSPRGSLRDSQIDSQRDSNLGAGACDISQRPPILRLGDKFGSNKVVQTITDILKEHIEGPWVTFPDVPNDVMARMFNRFKTRWSWDPRNEQVMYEGFRNVLKHRYRDIMGKIRDKAIREAGKAGHVIEKKDPSRFSIISEFPPSYIHHNIWRDMCKIWNKDEWKKKSETGTRNRASTDSTGKRSRHTGGSLGFDEHRMRLKNKMGKKPSFREVFLETHLTKESKARLWAGEIVINNLEGMDFCTARAEEIYGEYLKDMKELYGPEFTEDDIKVWKSVQAGGCSTRIFGIGSTDLNYLMTGTPSSSFGVGSSQDKILALENQIQDSKAQFEALEARLQAQREADRKAFEDILQAQREADRKSREYERQAMQKNFEEFLNQFLSSN